MIDLRANEHNGNAKKSPELNQMIKFDIFMFVLYDEYISYLALFTLFTPFSSSFISRPSLTREIIRVQEDRKKDSYFAGRLRNVRIHISYIFIYVASDLEYRRNRRMFR